MCKVGCAILSILAVVSAMSLVGEVNRSDLYIQNNDMPIVELAQSFSCSTKYCTKMRSCTEAVFHFKQCNQPDRDRDNDGIPCEVVCGKSLDEMRRILQKERG
jgi:hypothetical protein